MRKADLFAFVVVRLDVSVVLSDEVMRERPAIVRVGLSVGHRRVDHQKTLTGFQRTEVKLVVFRVVIFGFRERNTVFRDLRHAEAVAVRLHSRVAFAVFSDRLIHVRQKSAFRLAGNDVGVHVRVELMVARVRDLDAVEGFTVRFVTFASQRVRDAGGSEKVPLVSRVNERLPAPGLAVFHADGNDLRSVFLNAVLLHAVQIASAEDRNVVFLHEVLEDHFRDVRLKDPCGLRLIIETASALTGHSVIRDLRPGPRFRLLVVFPEPMVEFAGNSADDGSVSRVGRAESRRGKSAEMHIRANDDGIFAHAFCLDCRSHAGTGAAVDHDVVNRFVSRCRGTEKGLTEQECSQKKE